MMMQRAGAPAHQLMAQEVYALSGTERANAKLGFEHMIQLESPARNPVLTAPATTAFVSISATP